MVQDAMNESRRAKAELSEKVLKANRDLASRMDAEGLVIEYAPQDDYLRITIGKARPSVGIKWPDEIYSVALVDPDSGEINAVEAPFFMETVEGKQPQSELWEMVVDLVKEGRTSVYIPPRAERERTERALQGLVGT